MSAAQIEALSLAYSSAQESLQNALASRQQLETQHQENKIVLTEFEQLDDDAKVYKLTGAVLLPQELNEAKVNVEKRIEFIVREIERVEAQIKESQEAMEKKRQELIQLRSQSEEKK